MWKVIYIFYVGLSFSPVQYTVLNDTSPVPSGMLQVSKLKDLNKLWINVIICFIICNKDWNIFPLLTNTYLQSYIYIIFLKFIQNNKTPSRLKLWTSRIIIYFDGEVHHRIVDSFLRGCYIKCSKIMKIEISEITTCKSH